MGDKYDFERAERSPDFERRWLAKLSRGLREKAGEDVADAVMRGRRASHRTPMGER